MRKEDQEIGEIMSEDHDDSADLEWVPPSEAEQKIINARRERSDKISKVMGQYMLKGYKMLATCCPKCGTIELEDRQNQKYCVACEEVDCAETNKDNPAVNPEAARLQIAESRMTEMESQIETAGDSNPYNLILSAEVVPKHTGKYGNLLSLSFEKNFVKATFLLNCGKVL